MTAPLLTIHTDGASRGNPGAAAFAFVIARDGQPDVEEAGCLGRMTNNQAEYTALVYALEHALALGPAHRLLVHSDSELMVKQMAGEYRVKNADLLDLYERARELVRKFEGSVAFRHVRREFNKRADQLCNEALDGKRLGPVRLPPAEKAEVKRAAPAPAPRPAGLREEALACLRRARQAWAAGAEEPAPEAVWQELVETIRRHCLPG